MSDSHISINSRFDRVRDVDQFLETYLTRAGVGADDAYGTRVAVAEALNNVIEHGYRGADGCDIHVDMSLNGTELCVSIRDRGHPMSPGAASSALLPSFDPEDVESLPEGGWGLMLIEAYMDGTDYATSEDGQNTLSLRKQVSLDVDEAATNMHGSGD